MHPGKVVKTTVTEKMTTLFRTTCTFTHTTIFYLTYKMHRCYVHSLTVLSKKILALTLPGLVLWSAIMQNILHQGHFGSIQKVFKRKKSKFKINIIDCLVYKSRKYQFNASNICKSVQKSCSEKLSCA